ncbi:MAG: HAD family hydrolase [Candidatus Omnitrophota bacterium]
MEGIKLVIFDLDGTLVDAYKAIVKSVNFSLAALGYPTKRALDIKRSVGWGEAGLFEPQVAKRDLKKIINIYRRNHAKSLLKYSRALPGTMKVLKYLKKNKYKLAIASNRPTKYCRIILKHLDLERYFNVVLCADKLKHIKPHPQILFRIMKRFRCTPFQTVYVGDMVIDVQAGKRAGVRTIIVPTGSSSKKDIIKEKPWKIIRSQVDLLNML